MVIPVEDIAMDQGVVCLEGPLEGCLARLVRKGKRGIIRTRRGIKEDGRRRFAVAHELGHWFLHENQSQFFICSSKAMSDYKGSPMEVEANLFASELLMPISMCRRLYAKLEPSMQLGCEVANLFGTSLTASLMRLIDVWNQECILVLAKDGVIMWSKQSDYKSGLRIDKGTPLHADTLAKYSSMDELKLGPEEVPMESWISNATYGRCVEITEQCWHQEGYNASLSLLVITDADSDT